MNVKKHTNLLLMVALFVSSFMLLSCQSELTYESLVKEQLEKGVQNDSLFLGYTFGTDREKFREYSWQLNQEGILTGFVDINYETEFLKSKATMTFYPEFKDDKIVRLPVSVGYNAWAPWNEEYWPEELIKDLKEYYRNEYEAEFHNLYVPEIERRAEVFINGNREIRIYKNSESTVMVDFIDLNHVITLETEE